MVAIGISEFTFGYAFLFELTKAKWGDITAAPILPSLQQEQNLGWDASLPVRGVPYFYQFKLTEYLYHGNAEYLRNGFYSSPYFRISLHRRENNRQHRLLWTLGQQNQETYYAAPEVTTRDQFNDAFLKQAMLQKSRMIRLSDCTELKETDSARHVITFLPNDPTSTFHSEPHRMEHSYRGEEIQTAFRSTRGRWRELNVSFAKDLLDRTILAVRRVEDFENERAIISQRHLMDAGVTALNRADVLQRVADITATVFGATMVMIGSRPSS